MAEDDLNDRELDSFFAAARADAPLPSGTLLARVLADAEAAMIRPAGPAPAVRAASRGGLIDAALAAIGGWAGLGGLATATAAGVWIGFAGLADPLAAGEGLFTPSLSVELMPEADSFVTASVLE